MILLSCYIENYGKFSQIKIDFQKDLTVFCEENGFGKTTLVSFLKAMFYGLPSYKTSSKGFPERQHFYPFNGGKFGGSLEFEHGGKQYRVERFFDKKSDTKDECRIFCDTLETQDFGKNGELLGRSIFKLDEDSFVRTVFAEDLTAEISMTTDLFVALNRLVDDTDDDRNFENAIKDLNELRKKLHTDRGNHGLIPEQKEAIKCLEEKIGRFKNIHQKELETRYEEKREARSTSEQAALLLNQAIEQSYWQIYDTKKEQIVEKQKELEKLRAEYPHGIPTTEEQKCLHEYLKECAENRTVTAQSENEEAQKRFAELSCFFEEKKPTDAELSTVFATINETDRLKTVVKTLQNGLEQENLSPFVSRFQRKMPSDQQLAEMQENARLYREKQLRLQSFHYQGQEKTEVRKKSVFLGVIGGVFGIFSLLALLFSWLIALGGFLITAAVFAFVLFDSFDKKKTLTRARLAKEDALRSLQREIETLKENLFVSLSAFDYPRENDPNLIYERFCHEFESYCSFMDRQKGFQENIQEKNALLTEAQKTLQSFFADYPLEFLADDRQKFQLLRDNLNEYKRLSSERAFMQAQKEKAEARTNELSETINQIYQRYEIPLNAGTLKREFVFALASAKERENTLQKNLMVLEEDAQKHKNTYHLEKRPTVYLHETLDFYREADKAARTRENEIESRIRELEFELEELPELENELVRVKEKLLQYEQNHQKISQTVQFLQKAEQSLLDRYIAPVRDSFCKNASLIESMLGENIHMDKEYRITFERGGELRSDKHLSAGQHTISSLCMRLALAEQIYGESLPFLVLDDPFVHLDEKHLKKALQTVSELSKKTQILYFTCHSARAQFAK